jgi:tetratricopeptide (TPR) repeat protein
MKLLQLTFVLCLFITFNAFAKKTGNLNGNAEDTNKVISYIQHSVEFQASKPDSALLLAQQALLLSNKLNYTRGKANAYVAIANAYNTTGNYPKALSYYIKNLKIEEKRNRPDLIAIAHLNIASNFHLQKDYRKALYFAKQADSIVDADTIERLKLYVLLNLGEIYEKSDKIKAALDYTEKAFAYAVKNKDNDFIGAALNNLGNIYAKKGNTATAIQKYVLALQYLELANNQDFIAEASFGLAKQYEILGKTDSAEYFAAKSYAICKNSGFLSRQMDICIFLNNHFKILGNIEKAYAYQEETLLLKDSVFSKERISKSMIISAEEEVRQKEIAEQKQEKARERKLTMQYLGIGLCLPLLMFLTLYLINKKIKPAYIKFIGIVSLLLTFEYIMLLMHTITGKITHHLPIYQLIILAGIASILTPLHHRIEHWLLKRIAEKNTKKPERTEET